MVWHYSTYLSYRPDHIYFYSCASSASIETATQYLIVATLPGPTLPGPQPELIEWLVGRDPPQSPPRNSSNGLSVGEFSDPRMWHILCILFGSSCSRLFRFLGSRRSAPRSLGVSTLRSCSSSNESLSLLTWSCLTCCPWRRFLSCGPECRQRNLQPPHKCLHRDPVQSGYECPVDRR